MSATPSTGSQASRQSQQDAISYLPLAARLLPWRDLLAQAQGNLRCIEWENIRKDIMIGAICGAGDQKVNTNALFELSRPLSPDEQADYFMSHSWHDNAKAKWDRTVQSKT